MALENKGRAHHSRKESIPLFDGLSDIKYTASHADTNTSEFEALDQQVTQSTTFQSLWGIIRKLSSQPTFSDMVKCLELEAGKLVNARSVRYLMKQGTSFIHHKQYLPANKGVANKVFNSREIVNLANPAEAKGFAPEIDADYTIGPNGPLAVLPVVSDGDDSKEVIGVIMLHRTKGSPPFSAGDCTAMYRVSEFAANMLQNAARMDSMNQRYGEQLAIQKRGQVMLDIAHALGSENRLGPLIALIVQKVPSLLDCDRTTLFLVDKERNELVVRKNSSHGRPKSFVGWIFGMANAPELPFPPGTEEIRFSMSKGIAGYVGSTGEALNVIDAHLDPRFNPAFDKATGYRTRSILCMPMLDANDEVIGVLQAINKNPELGHFSRGDEMMLETFCAQAAVAVKNSKLFEQTQKALEKSEALLDVTTHLAKELKLFPLLQAIVKKVQTLLRAQRCTVFLVDHDKKELKTSDAMTCGMGAPLPIDHEKQEMIRFPMNAGIAGSVATSKVAVRISDAYNDSRFNPQMDQKTHFHTKSILCCPIVDHHNNIIGVTQAINKILDPNFDEKNPDLSLIREFDDEDERMLYAFNSQAAVAIENSNLYTQTERALNHSMAEIRNLKFLIGVTKNLFSDMHMTSMIEQMTMQVHHLLKADNCCLYLVDNDTQEFYKAKEDEDAQHRRYRFNVGIVGLVASTGRTVRISKDAFKDPNFDAQVDQRRGKTTHSILCCPITARTHDETQVIGVISVRDEKDRGGFEREEENLLKVFCAQAAVAIINSKRFSSMLDQSDYKTADHTAADYLVQDYGMQLAGNDIERFQYSMDEIKLVNRIGAGSYGEVFKAKLRGSVVAVKKLHVHSLKAEQVDSFCSEASLMCQLEHPNVVMFIGAVTEPAHLCIITQYCARGSLADLLLDPTVPMDYAKKLKFALDACRGMVYLHSSNPTILHRDLKSDNLLVGADWTVKVADFGLTRFLSEKKAMTQVGTPMWMAPEIIMGRQYTEKADVYAFGIILWEILTRLEPYEDKEPMQIVVEVVNEDLRPDLPSEFKNNPLVPLMTDCWHPDPTQRPTFKVAQERLEELYEREQARLARNGVPTPRRR